MKDLCGVFEQRSRFFLSDLENKELVQKQVDMINKQLNMGVSVENIVSDVDISSSLQNSSREIKNKVSAQISSVFFSQFLIVH